MDLHMVKSRGTTALDAEPTVWGTRRALDADGWDSDVSLLRKQLAAGERRLLQTRLAARLDGAAEPGDTCSLPARWLALR